MQKLEKKKERVYKPQYKDGDYAIVELDRKKTKSLIENDLTIPQIAELMPEYTYEQVYDTILCDSEYNNLYRNHAQRKLVRRNGNLIPGLRGKKSA